MRTAKLLGRNVFRRQHHKTGFQAQQQSVCPFTAQAVGGDLSAERKAAWAAWAADWRQKLQADARPDAERRAAQNAVNPAYIPRNHVMQAAIAAAEERDFSEVCYIVTLFRRSVASSATM